MTLLAAIALIGLGAWGAFDGGEFNKTALIPVVFGVVLLALVPGVRKENKVVAHIAVSLVLLITLALFMPLMKAIGRSNTPAILRVGAMVVMCVLALVSYIQSFIAARKAREA